ncbi:hypothetical protein B0H13DRAFT_1896623 [Mycena leptocephala]|nr:hypothetical protein B0H13DRAFT_1896623 [Mycena leptocephala]
MSDLSSEETGYTSDTGARDNPTLWNFENNEPVKRTIDPSQWSRNARCLNREGRAICRIAHANGWAIHQISDIFRIQPKAIRNAVQNKYSPPDNTSDDYAKVGAEWKEKFPKMEARPVEKRRRNEGEGTGDSDKIAHQTVKRARRSQGLQSQVHPFPPCCSAVHPTDGLPVWGLNFQWHGPRIPPSPFGTSPNHRDIRIFTKLNLTVEQALGLWSDAQAIPRSLNQINDVQASLPRPLAGPPAKRAPAAGPPGTVAAFLKNVMHLDLTKHLALFTARGFEDMATLRTMARLDASTLSVTLRRLLTGSVQELGGRKGLTDVELVMLELAIRELK